MGIVNTSADVVTSKCGIFAQYYVDVDIVSKLVKHYLDRNARTSNNRLSNHHLWINGDSLAKFAFHPKLSSRC